jgi:ABC-type antimicrobial peptide transport system ATPase subunit
VNQSIVSLKTNAIVKKHTPAELKTYLYGDQIGTTGLAYIDNYIKPTRSPRVYSTLADAVLALQTKQIVAIVRSLTMQPSLLLLDEVTSALDPTLVGEVLDLLTELAKSGTTMLIATHEMNFARDVAHQAAFLDHGVLVEQGTPEELFERPHHDATRVFLERVR